MADRGEQGREGRRLRGRSDEANDEDGFGVGEPLEAAGGALSQEGCLAAASRPVQEEGVDGGALDVVLDLLDFLLTPVEDLTEGERERNR